jgi:small subunit ribosomal protein S5
MPRPQAGGGGSSSSSDDDTDDEAGPSGSQAAKKAGKGRRAAAGTPAKPPRGAQAGAAAAPGGGEAAAGEEDGAAPFASVLAGGSRIEAMLHEMETSNRTRARFIMQRILDGKEASAFPRLPTDDPAADAEAEAAEAAFLGRFRTRVVDVTRSSKGSNTGSVSRFSAMVVAGNGAGVLGLGTGRAAEVADAVRKATVAALGGASLFFVPRHARTTVLAPSTAWYGSVKASVFPLPTGRGIRAGPLAAGVCRLAGLADVGVKLHGARTPRNAVKALIKALEGGATLAGAAREAAAAGGVPGGARVRVRELVSAGVGGPGQRKVRRVGGVGGAWFK